MNKSSFLAKHVLHRGHKHDKKFTKYFKLFLMEMNVNIDKTLQFCQI